MRRYVIRCDDYDDIDNFVYLHIFCLWDGCDQQKRVSRHGHHSRGYSFQSVSFSIQK